MIPPLCRIEIPVATVSEANRASHEHWRKRHKRADAQNNTTMVAMRAAFDGWKHVRLPLAVVLVRHSVGTLDDGNLGAALKYIQDGVTDALGTWLPKGEGPRAHNKRAPGFAKPINSHYDDRDRLSWHYAQSKCKRGEERVDVLLYSPGCVARHLLSLDRAALDAWLVKHATGLDALLIDAHKWPTKEVSK